MVSKHALTFNPVLRSPPPALIGLMISMDSAGENSLPIVEMLSEFMRLQAFLNVFYGLKVAQANRESML